MFASVLSDTINGLEIAATGRRRHDSEECDASVAAVRATRVPMMFVDAAGGEGSIVFVNAAFLRLTGYTLADLIDRPFGVVLDEGRDRAVALIAAADDEAEICCRRRHGGTFRAAVALSSIGDAATAGRCFLVSFIDQTRHIAERERILAAAAEAVREADAVRALHAATIRTAQLTAVGMVGAALADEINQPLAAMTNYLRGARRRMTTAATPLPDGVLGALAEADRSAVLASQIVRRVRDTAREPRNTMRRANVRAMIVAACDLALVAASPSIDLELRVDDDPEVIVDPVETQQVLIGLISNAVDAVAGRPLRRILVSATARPDRSCEVAVRDSGTGVPAEAMPRLFEPFNSTKAGGAGIGLSIGRTIVGSHGGRFWLESSTGEGADFRFSLPLAV